MKAKSLAHSVLILLASLGPIRAQPTAFTYQGRLDDGVNPASGRYDLRIDIFDDATGGNRQGVVTNSAVAVSNGLFTTMLDFGSGVFTGEPRWLELAVRTNGGGAFVTLAPRQAVLPTPYAITASSVLSGGLASGTYGNAVTLSNAANQITGSFTGNGANVTNVNASALSGVTSAGFWRTNGNGGANPTNGAFLGTADNLPLEFKANSQRALRLEPNATSPNLIGGSAYNVVSNVVVGAFIGGGGSEPYPNQVTADYGAVLGGFGNVAGGVNSTAFGNQSRAYGPNSTAFGSGCVASNDYAVAMGSATRAEGASSTAMGASTVAGGVASLAAGDSSQALGLASVAAGYQSTASGESAIAIGFQARASSYGAVALGSQARATNINSIAIGAALSQGQGAVALGEVVGAYGFGSVAIGHNVSAHQPLATAMGYRAQARHEGSFVWADASEVFTDFESTTTNQFSIRAVGGVRLNNNTSLGFGNRTRQMVNLWNAEYGIGVQGDAQYFRTGNDFHWYRGGSHSDVNGNGGSGGAVLMTLSRTGRIGLGNTTPSYSLDVQAGQAVGRFTSTNTVNGSVPVLQNTTPSSTYLGAINFDSANSTPGQIGYLASDDLAFRVGGTERMRLNSGGLTVNGTFVSASDRNVKKDFASVDAQEVLNKVAALPLQSWSYTNRPGVKHVGPMAQDFRAAFGLGEDDKHIATVDADGVALAAIQGLNQKLEETRAENAELRARLEKLEQLLNARNGGAQ